MCVCVRAIYPGSTKKPDEKKCEGKKKKKSELNETYEKAAIGR